ncbi:MAG: hypothetical protein KKC37_01735, partial [Proteobacteria bacterium]|nr:hypothetical protein [Pseudomonadota bacterium]
LTNFWNKVKLVWEGVTTLIGSFTGKAGTMSSELADKLKKAGLFKFVVGVFRFFARARAFITGLFEGIWSAVSPVLKQIWSGLQGIWRAIQPVFQWIGKLFGGLGSLATGGTLSGIRSIGQAVGRFIVTPFRWAWKVMSKGLLIAQGIIKGLVKALAPVWAVIVNVFQSVKSSLKPLFDLFGKLWTWVSKLFGGSGSDKTRGWVRAGEIIGNVLGGIIKVVAHVIGTVVKIIAWGIGAAVRIFSSLVDAGAWVWGQIKKGAQAVGNFFAGVWNTIKSAASSVWQAIKNTVTGILSGIVTVAKRIFAGMLKIILAPIKGVLWIASAFSSRAGRAYDRIKAWETSLTGQGKKAKATGEETAKTRPTGGLTERPAVKRARQTIVQQAISQHTGGDTPGFQGVDSTVINAVMAQVATGQQTQQTGFNQMAAAISQLAKRAVIVQIDGREVARVVAAEAGESVRRSLGL